jgi:hypothetical protein
MPHEPHPEHTPPAEPAPANTPMYLRELEVQGLGGIARPITLELEPRPGLTLVLGRNNAGKSSFVDAIELLLTNACPRWAGAPGLAPPRVWRNRDHEHLPRIRAVFAVAGAGLRLGPGLGSGRRDHRDREHQHQALGEAAATIELVREWFTDDLEANDLRATIVGQPHEPLALTREAEQFGARLFVRAADMGSSVLSDSERQLLAARQRLAEASAAPTRLRFVIVDDPVPTLDADGLAEFAATLAALARTQQVLTFTRDPRLVDALGPLVGARILDMASA